MVVRDRLSGHGEEVTGRTRGMPTILKSRESRAILPGAWVPPAQACQAPIAGARPVASQRSEG
jgi:hypothetical protein